MKNINKKILIAALVFLVGLAITSSLLLGTGIQNKPVTITLNASLGEMTIDDKIEEAELIVVGEVKEILPSKWKSVNQQIPERLTPQQIIESNLSIFTDSLISINQILKGGSKEPVVRVRSFAGEINQAHFVSSSEPAYKMGQTYLLFLHKDNGPTQIVDPGDYIAVNAINGVYNIVGDKAISSYDEWHLDDLVMYIQSSPLSAPEENIPETPNSQEIMKVVELAYDIESKAAYDFKTGGFSSVFANTLLFSLNVDKFEFVKNFNPNFLMDSPGYLDYKIAYYNWWQESAFQFDALKQKARLENREVTQDELKALIDSEWAEKWGLAPARAESPERKISLRFISINVVNDMAVVYLHDGFRVVILYLSRIDGQWFIVGDKENTLSAEALSPAITPAPTELLTETPTELPTQTLTPTETAGPTP